jgi:hypothetical protein
VAFGDIAVAATTASVDWSTVMPTNAVIEQVYATVTVAFDDGGAGTFKLDFGVKTTDPDAIIDGAAGNLDATGVINGPQGIAPSGFYSGAQLAFAFTGDVDLDTLTAGSVTVTIVYKDMTGYLS